MAQRRFGPVSGAGVAVVEAEADRSVQPAPLGNVLFAGKLLRGKPDELIQTVSKDDMLRKVGDHIDGSEVHEAALDFWSHGNGRGEAYFIRLTDGTEEEAAETIYGRKLGHGFVAGRYADAGWDEVKVPILIWTAASGGRHGGRFQLITGDVSVVATDITATTLDTAVTMLEDEFAGATLILKGVTARTYVVVSNTTAGVLTVESDCDMAADLAAGASPAEAGYEIVLDNEVLVWPTRIAGTRRAQSLIFKDGEEDETNLFGLEVWVDEVKMLDYPNLSIDPTNKWYAENVINEDPSNYEGEIEVLYSGSILADLRPANWCGVAWDWASDVMTARICHVRSVTSTNPDVGWVGNFTNPSNNQIRKQRITLTFTGAAAFTVTTTESEGAHLRNLPNGTVGTAYTSDNDYMPGFTVFDGDDAWTATDTIVIDVLPFPVDADGNGLLAGGYLYPDVGTDKRNRIKIKDNTPTTITLVTAPSAAPAECAAAATAINTGTLVFPLTLVNQTLKVYHSSFGIATMTLAAGPHAAVANLVAEINTQWQTVSGSAGDIAAVQTSPANSVDLMIDDSGVDTERGYENFLIVFAANADLGLAAGDSIVGTLGAEFRVQARQELRAGYDGTDPGTTEHLAATADPTTSLVARFEGQNKGLIKIATPGVSTTSVQQAWLALAEALSYQYRVEIPVATTTETAAIAYINDTIGRSDFGVAHFPTYANVQNPRGSGTVSRPMTGMLLGREALIAANYLGYHKAAAGVDVTLPNVVSLPTGNTRLNEEVLTPAGLNVIKKLRGNYVVWGDRTIALDPTWRFKHVREQMSHYTRTLLESFDWIVFALNDRYTRAQLVTALYSLFLPEWRKRALSGERFEDACQIKADAENNTPATIAAGDLNAKITLAPAGVVERLVLTVGQRGIFEDTAV